jgi:hypothetical protein
MDDNHEFMDMLENAKNARYLWHKAAVAKPVIT